MLLLPYFVWVIAAAYSFLFIWPLIYSIGIIPGVAQILVAMYGVGSALVLGIVFWGVPYTVFVVAFLLWSRKKSVQKTSSALLYAPPFLALICSPGLMILGLTFSLADGKLPPLEDWRNLGLISVLAAALCLLYGYLFVGA